jgi:low temperature requirement protein LtrA
VAGIVLVALGVEQVLELVGHTTDGELSQHLPILQLTALYGGVAIFLFAHVAFKYRTWRRVTVRRLVVGSLLCALIPLALELPALAALGLLTAIFVAMIATEAVRYAEAREQVRHEDGGPEVHGAHTPADRPASGS